MILCEKCDKHKKIIAVESDHIILLCGHIKSIFGNTTMCRQCNKTVEIVFIDKKPTLSCGHIRTEKDDRLDKFSDRYRASLKKKAKEKGLTLEEYNKGVRKVLDRLLDDDFYMRCGNVTQLQIEPTWHEGNLGDIIAPAKEPNPLFQTTKGWFFHDECWSRAYGPFDTGKQAQKACEEYAKTL